MGMYDALIERWLGLERSVALQSGYLYIRELMIDLKTSSTL